MEQTSLYRAAAQVRRSEDGASTAVYAGMIVVVVILVVALAAGMTPVGQSLASGVSNQICKIFDLSCGGDDPGSTDDQAGQTEGDKKPVDPLRPGECVIASRKSSSSGDVKVTVVKVGGETSFLKQQEQYYDTKTGEVKNRYRLIATKGGTLGGEVGIGTKGEIGESGIGADLKAGASGTLKGGDTWEFGSEEEMNAFVEDYIEYQMEWLEAVRDPFRGAYMLATGDYPVLPRGADKTSTALKAEALLDGDVGLRVGKDNEETGEKSVNLNAGARAKATVGKEITYTRDHRPGHEGEYSVTVGYEGDISGGLDAVFVGLGGTGSYKGTITYGFKPGSEGKPALDSVTFDQVTYGDGLIWKATNGPIDRVGATKGKVSGEDTSKQTHVTKTKLKVTDANRDVVQNWAFQSLLLSGGDAGYILLPPNIIDPSSPSPDDPIAQLLYEGATSAHTTYDVNSDKFSLRGEVALGLKLGGGLSWSSEDQTLAGSTYLESPSSPGAPRQRVDNLVCN